ncbi:hypothetical protein L2E82_15733 [Cichorium intybus]|uniref:Uncharacterized protein n=1 Tax=Cichorium intybus TaxID=13427 RepID=A0ACB9F429_CICIN|nr:hypothetical protein L2E82_15733 [Cichorium intybus]
MAPFFFFLLVIFSFADGGSIGVNYGRIANNLPIPQRNVADSSSETFLGSNQWTEFTITGALAVSIIFIIFALSQSSFVHCNLQESKNFVNAISHYHPNTKFYRYSSAVTFIKNSESCPFLPYYGVPFYAIDLLVDLT